MKKIPGNSLKNLEKSWNFVSPEKWEPWVGWGSGGDWVGSGGDWVGSGGIFQTSSKVHTEFQSNRSPKGIPIWSGGIELILGCFSPSPPPEDESQGIDN